MDLSPGLDDVERVRDGRSDAVAEGGGAELHDGVGLHLFREGKLQPVVEQHRKAVERAVGQLLQHEAAVDSADALGLEHLGDHAEGSGVSLLDGDLSLDHHLLFDHFHWHPCGAAAHLRGDAGAEVREVALGRERRLDGRHAEEKQRLRGRGTHQDDAETLVEGHEAFIAHDVLEAVEQAFVHVAHGSLGGSLRRALRHEPCFHRAHRVRQHVGECARQRAGHEDVGSVHGCECLSIRGGGVDASRKTQGRGNFWQETLIGFVEEDGQDGFKSV